jgi:hypothetical protein
VHNTHVFLYSSSFNIESERGSQSRYIIFRDPIGGGLSALILLQHREFIADNFRQQPQPSAQVYRRETIAV